MSRRLRILLALLALALLLVGLHRFGRPLWQPTLDTVRGEETVASVLSWTTAKGLGLTESERAWVRGLTLIGLKDERRLEVWGHDEGERRELLRAYAFTGYSGRLGPKLQEGDGQIPEGIYRAEYLNPNSSYHLSIKIDYPNAFDEEKGRADGREGLGFDIFLHGRSATVGCIPIGDDAVEDLFTLVAQVGVKKVGVIIAPWDFRVRDDEPSIAAVDWEGELYEALRIALNPFPRVSEDSL